MKNLHDIWARRLQKYTAEVQNYFKYIFTGHIAIVLLFAIGAAGFAYSEWVQDIPENFPGALLMAVIFGVLLAYSPPSTLLKRADMVYFLPMESRLGEFMKPALRWSYFSQLYLPVVAFIVSLPMINALYGLPSSYLIGFPILLLILKWWNVQTEFAVRKRTAGEKVWVDRLLRFFVAAAFVYLYIMESVFFAALFLFVMIIYGRWAQQQTVNHAFPYEHFIDLEENRMLRFYQFANYFTDVPHIKGKVKKRAWLNWVYNIIKSGPQNAHYYLVWRTFVRSDELFYLWVRLTIITMAGAWLIPFPVAVAIFSAALAFASAIQLWQSMTQANHFRMDNLFPLTRFSRQQAVFKLVMILQTVTAFLTLSVLLIRGEPVTAILIFAVILIVSSVTLSVSKNKKKK